MLRIVIKTDVAGKERVKRCPVPMKRSSSPVLMERFFTAKLAIVIVAVVRRSTSGRISQVLLKSLITVVRTIEIATGSHPSLSTTTSDSQLTILTYLEHPRRRDTLTTIHYRVRSCIESNRREVHNARPSRTYQRSRSMVSHEGAMVSRVTVQYSTYSVYSTHFPKVRVTHHNSRRRGQ